MVAGTNDPDNPELKKPEPSDAMDLLGRELGVDPLIVDKAKLAQRVDSSLDQTLRLLQILYYAQELGQDKLCDKLLRYYRPVIELMAEETDKAMNEFQKKHGEI